MTLADIQRHIGVPADGKWGPVTAAAVAKALGMTSLQNTQRTISPEGIALIRRFEGCELLAYPDPGTGGKPWTIGVGTTVYPDGRAVKAGDTITAEQAEEYLRHDLARFEAAARKLFPVATQAQFDALVSWIYNIGEEAARTSTLRRKHNEGDYSGAAAEFGKWVLAAGKKLPGLVKRRAAEAALYGKETP